MRRFTINGATFELDGAGVERVVADVLPEPINEHFAVVRGRRYPPKQMIGLATGVDRADFTTYQARRILRRLGFSVDRLAPRSANVDGDAAPRSADVVPAERLRTFAGEWVAVRGGEVLVAADSVRRVRDLRLPRVGGASSRGVTRATRAAPIRWQACVYASPS